MKKFAELVKNFMADSEIELKEEEIEKAKGLSPEKAEELTGAIETLNDYKEDWPNELIGAVTTLTKNSVYDYPEKESGEKGFDIEEFIAKAGQKFSKATLEQLKKAITIIQGLIGDREEKVKKKHKDLPDDVVAELEELALLKREKEEEVKKAEAETKKKEQERIEKLEKEIEEMKKADKTGIEGQDTDDNGNGEGDKDVKKKKDELFPSLNRGLFPGYYRGRRG